MKVITNVLLLMTLFFAFNTSSFADSVILKAVVFKPASGGGLPRTGQTASYIPGDDGTYHAGYPKHPAAQYTDNGNNTVTDNGTGLTWIKDTSNVSGYNLDTAVCFGPALTEIAALNTANYAGHKDWRMPNINELMSLIDVLIPTPQQAPLPQCNFINSIFTRSNGYYWSGTMPPNHMSVQYILFPISNTPIQSCLPIMYKMKKPLSAQFVVGYTIKVLVVFR